MMVFYWMLNVLTKVFMMVLGAMIGEGIPFQPDKEPGHSDKSLIY